MYANFARRFSFLTLLALFGASAHAQPSAAVAVNDYDVYVDLPTAFAFIKLPGAWKFVGKLDAEQLRQLPAGTLTSLLPAEQPQLSKG